ncbi:tRNA (adenosine(37)-N6)-dimethylallyltransferase MiaA [Raoultibacter massiliensis]|uniref:tRNA (adenosine(37)-N6)-dimethylallyltransferase MiaA n=1 Tax=Raoultibacter massiliensis TaxID=1852371 RepID=UPI000C829BD6|nr:tRNA (adenosine(37)-N6)-dimethylallyltransferase MiaA [Raoultibacter massiliensis]
MPNSDSTADIARPVICIVGPTASGKSDLAQLVAAAIGGEVVSADSMQVYKGMDIGTGKVPPEDRIVAHHGLDLVDPGEPYSAALFQDYARSCFSDIAMRGKRSVLAGGTGLYIRAAIDDYDFPKGEQVENPVRERYMRFADEQGGQALWEELNRVDPASAQLIHPHNVRRVVRAFEMLSEGTNYAAQHARLQSMPQAIDAIVYGLEVTPGVLAQRIESRVDAMIEQGLVAEVKSLLQRGFREGVTAPQAIGYKEIVAALEGEGTLDDAVVRIKTATRRYAKRQRTWFRKDKRIVWIDADEGDAGRLAERVLFDLHDRGAQER